MEAILAWALAKYPVALSLLAIVGLIRMVVKPLMTFLGELVIIIPGKKDDELLNKLEHSKIFKGFLFVLDYLGSIKVKTKVDK